MNQFMKQQIENIIQIADTFKVMLEISAQKDDGKITKDELKEIQKLNKITDDFIKKLKKV